MFLFKCLLNLILIRKSQKGRSWVFGIVERVTNKCYLLPIGIEKRCLKSLIDECYLAPLTFLTADEPTLQSKHALRNIL